MMNNNRTIRFLGYVFETTNNYYNLQSIFLESSSGRRQYRALGTSFMFHGPLLIAVRTDVGNNEELKETRLWKFVCGSI